MEYQGDSSQNYYNYPKLQLVSYGSNNSFASSMNSQIDIASHNYTRYIVSANAFDIGPHHMHPGYYGQEQMSTMNSSSFDFSSNIQYAYPYSSAISSQYVIKPQDVPMN
jgi:hypothetical protein